VFKILVMGKSNSYFEICHILHPHYEVGVLSYHNFLACSLCDSSFTSNSSLIYASKSLRILLVYGKETTMTSSDSLHLYQTFS
jgi:hypothetical protein